MNLVQRALNYDTYFDRVRLELRTIANLQSQREIEAELIDSLRGKAILDAARLNAVRRMDADTVEEIDRFVDARIASGIGPRTSDSVRYIERMNALLPDALPPGNIMQAVPALLAAKGGVTDEILEMVDIYIVGCIHSLLFGVETRLLMIEPDLMRQVLRANNQPIAAEDLFFVPYNRCFLEFGSPVEFLKHEDKSLSAKAVGFFADSTARSFAVLWYTSIPKDRSKMHEQTPKQFPVVASMAFLPGNVRRVTMDAEAQLALGIHPSCFGVEMHGVNMAMGGSDKGRRRMTAAMDTVNASLAVASRNIWDFVTCRNIDYERVHRPAKDYSAIKKYRHIQGLNVQGRDVRIIRVNRTVEITDKEGGAGEHPLLPYHYEVCGCFHKWVYCGACFAVHRHDLIGRPCRKCKTVVGPFANVTMKKFWHSPYWCGPADAPVREVVREIRK